MKYRVLEGAAPEIYGKDVKAGDTLSLTKAQAQHLLAKGHIEEAGGEDDAKPPETVEATEMAAPVGGTVPAARKGTAGGRGD